MQPLGGVLRTHGRGLAGQLTIGIGQLGVLNSDAPSLKVLPISAPRARYPGFKPGKWTLKAGLVRRAGARPLPVDIVFERDVAMQLRDGTTLYADVFRPANDARVPAIFNWSPCGGKLGLR